MFLVFLAVACSETAYCVWEGGGAGGGLSGGGGRGGLYTQTRKFMNPHSGGAR